MRATVIAACLILGGCATIGRLTDPEYFQKQSSMQLCMDLMSSPSGNVNRTARMEELSRRGENCSQYGGLAAIQVERDRQTVQTIGAGAALLSSPPPVAPTTCRWFAGNYICQ